jgi:hypothetical protein
MRCPACGAVDAPDHRESSLLGIPTLMCPWMPEGRVLLSTPVSAVGSAVRRSELERRAATPGADAREPRP